MGGEIYNLEKKNSSSSGNCEAQWKIPVNPLER